MSTTGSGHGRAIAVTRKGSGPPVLLVHGGASAATTWRGLEPLESCWTLLMVHRRGFEPSPPPTAGRQDFEEDAADLLPLLAERPHVVAHSYGGVGAMLAVATAPERVRSLTLIEPAVHLLAGDAEADRFRRIGEEFLEKGLDTDPSTMREFLRAAGSPLPDSGPLPDDVVAAVRRAQGSRSPYEADLPLQRLRESGMPILVSSSGEVGSFERNMDALAMALGGRRLVAPGAGHFVPRAGGFAERLNDFLASATGA